MGLAEGPFLPVCQSLVASESEHSRRGHNMGVMQNFGSNILGSFLAPLVLIRHRRALELARVVLPGGRARAW